MAVASHARDVDAGEARGVFRRGIRVPEVESGRFTSPVLVADDVRKRIGRFDSRGFEIESGLSTRDSGPC
jgi:hypothetical protein